MKTSWTPNRRSRPPDSIPASPTPSRHTEQYGARSARRHCAAKRARARGSTAGWHDVRGWGGRGTGRGPSVSRHKGYITGQVDKHDAVLATAPWTQGNAGWASGGHVPSVRATCEVDPDVGGGERGRGLAGTGTLIPAARHATPTSSSPCRADTQRARQTAAAGARLKRQVDDGGTSATPADELAVCARLRPQDVLPALIFRLRSFRTGAEALDVGI